MTYHQSILFLRTFDNLKISDLWDDNSFRRSREGGILRLRQMIAAAKDIASLDTTPKALHTSKEHSVIIVDDIMYLHSMRRAVYVSTRDLDVHHLLIVRVTADLPIALARNSLRVESKRMSDETVKKIFNNFEEPNSSNVHEKFSLCVDTTTNTRSVEQHFNHTEMPFLTDC